MRTVITLLTDFGISDEFVSSMKQRIYWLNPGQKIVDITHQIHSFDILKASFVMAVSALIYPKSVHVCVVDPGVGTKRKAIAVLSKYGHWFIGPDNGVLISGVERAGGPLEAYEIKPEMFSCWKVSSTFHGRDIFAPAAALLSLDGEGQMIGDLIDASVLLPSPIKKPKPTKKGLKVQVVDIDKFGNIRLGAWLGTENMLDENDNFEIILNSGRLNVKKRKVFLQAKRDECFIYPDSSGVYGISANRRSAAEILDLNPGNFLTIKRR